MLVLFCAVVGSVRRVFHVEIDDDKTASELKAAVVDQSRGAITTPPMDLQLFLAKKNDAWLEYDDLDAVLQRGDVTSYHRMPEPFKLNNSKLFGSDVSLGEGVIHVLVVLPPAMAVSSTLNLGNIVSIHCAIVGDAGKLFAVDIDESKKVYNLKEAICTRQQYQFRVDDMRLFLAKSNNEWLDGDDAAALSLDIYGRPQGFTELMNPLLPLKDDNHFGAGFQSGRGQIQVLVVLPFGVMINIEEEKGNAELELYQQRGKEIQDKCGDYCRPILENIDTLYQLNSKHPLPFLCVEGSSGMGKSQLAFALGGNRPWFYWPVTSLGDDSQRLYKNFTAISKAFEKVTRDDKPMDKAESDILNCRSCIYGEECLWAYGFILMLLKYSCLEGHQAGEMLRIEEEALLYVEKCNLATIADFRERMKSDGKLLPFFVLDEMTPSAGDAKLAAFQRNVFRACGLVVVLMGTDAKITDLVFQQNGGGFKEKCHWVTIFPRFPPIQPMKFMDEEKQAVWDDVQSQYRILEVIVKNSRGRFSRYFAERVVEYVSTRSGFNLCDLLDDALGEVHRLTSAGKDFMNKENGPEAQMMAISYTNAEPVNLPGTSNDIEGGSTKRMKSWGGKELVTKKRKLEKGVDYMHIHFANLIDEQPSNIDVLNGKLYTGKFVWEPKFRFPTIEEDLLLYLAVLGGKKYSAYFCANVTRPVFQVFWMHWRGFQLYEEMVAQMIFCASRRNGVRGIQFKDFLPCLLQEFQDNAERKPMTVDGEEKTTQEILQGYRDSGFLTSTVPFLAPPNAQWPPCVLDTRENGCNFGHFVHTNQERKGLCVYEAGVSGTPLFLCECRLNVDVDALTEMIDRLDSVWKGDHEWKIVLLFCVKLAEIQKVSWKRRDVGCVKIKCRGKSTCRVEWVFHPDEGARKKLIIAMETEK